MGNWCQEIFFNLLSLQSLASFVIRRQKTSDQVQVFWRFRDK